MGLSLGMLYGGAAEVAIETIRYYQRRRLLAVPQSGGGMRRYPTSTIDRIRFIKRSQDLGFSRGAIRKIAGDRLANCRIAHKPNR